VKPLNHPEAEAFLRSIAAKPGDGLPRLIFADWLDDNGHHNAAAGQRWAAKHGKYPRPSGEVVADPGVGHHTAGGWSIGGHSPALLSVPHALPDPFFDTERMAGGEQRYYRTKLYTSGPEPHDHERAFLDAAARMNWHPDTGEPLPPEAP
jgi:uncharacterized protein (TIGR02996 family)